jgi:hypothetical protein
MSRARFAVLTSLTGLLLVVAGSASSAPPAPKGPLKKTGPATLFPANLIKMNKRAAIAHKPFPVAHPQTGKALNPGDMLTLANGKKVKSSDYFAQLNDLEKKLNSHGHSLRHPAKKVVLGETIIDRAKMAAQARTLAAKHRIFDPRTMRRPTPFKGLAAAHKAAVTKARGAAGKTTRPPAPGKTTRPAPGKTTRPPKQGVSTEQEDLFLTAAQAAPTKGQSDHELQKISGFEMGQKDLAAVFLDGQWETTVSPSAVDVKGEVAAGLYLVNNRIEALKVTATMHGVAGGQGSAQINVSVLGASVFNQPIPMNKSGQLNKTFEPSPFKKTFMAGPIPITVTIGARGGVGLQYFTAISGTPLLASVQVVPSASVEFFAQAGIGITILNFGIEGKLQLLQFVLTLGSEAGVKSDAGGPPKLSLFVHGESDITLLKGDIGFYAEMDVLFFKKKFTFPFFSWKGFEKKGTMFNVPRSTPLPAAPATPAQAPRKAA